MDKGLPWTLAKGIRVRKEERRGRWEEQNNRGVGDKVGGGGGESGVC